jgi:hypothetical protein
MLQVKRASLGGEKTFLFEEDVPDSRALANVGIGGARDKIDFDAAMATIREAAESMAQGLIQLPSAPTGLEVTFGVKLSTELGAFVAKASGEANFTVKLTWSKPR